MSERGDESEADDESDRGDGDYLREVPDGAGCTEIWEHLSEERTEGSDG